MCEDVCVRMMYCMSECVKVGTNQYIEQYS